MSVVANTASTADNSSLNVTGLLPNIEYTFRVQAVASVLGVDSPSELSELAMDTTNISGKLDINYGMGDGIGQL